MAAGEIDLLRYSEVRTFEPVQIGNGRTRDATVNHQAVIYISDRGRIFAQAQRNIIAEGRYNRSFNMIKSPGLDKHKVRLAVRGRKSLRIHQTRGKARWRGVAVRFSRDSQTCTVTIGYARARGSETIIVQGWAWRAMAESW